MFNIFQKEKNNSKTQTVTVYIIYGWTSWKRTYFNYSSFQEIQMK